MTIGNHIPEDDLVLFALQLLPEDRTRQAKLHAETCDLCRGEIAKLQGDLASYSTISDIVAPPPEARERLLRQVAKEPKPVLPPEPLPAPVAVVDDEDFEPHPPRRRRGEHAVERARQQRVAPVRANREAEIEGHGRRTPYRIRRNRRAG